MSARSGFAWPEVSVEAALKFRAPPLLDEPLDSLAQAWVGLVDPKGRQGGDWRRFGLRSDGLQQILGRTGPAEDGDGQKKLLPQLGRMTPLYALPERIERFGQARLGSPN